MTTLTITTKGQITLRKDILRALGVGPGDKVDAQLAPGGVVTLRRAQRSGSIENFIGALRDKVDRQLSVEEINDVIAQGWSTKQ